MSEKEPFTTTLNAQLLEDIKILAVKKKCSTNVLIEEAISMLLEKYKKVSKDKEQGNLFK
jgi:hypothetical protein